MNTTYWYNISQNTNIQNVIVNNNFTSMRGEKLFIDLETGKINFLSDSAENNKIRGQLLENDKNKEIIKVSHEKHFFN